MNATEPPMCGFDGNPDLYGLGVRTGIYIQAVSFFLAAFHLKKESAYLQSSAFVFLLAIFIALIRETANRTLRAPEAALISWMIGYQMMGVVAISPAALSAGALLRMAFVLFIFMGYIGYNGWFWWTGLKVLPQPAPGCVEYGYMFAKVNIRGWFQTVSKVMWTMAVAIFCFPALIFGVILLVGGIMGRKVIWAWWKKKKHATEEEGLDTTRPVPIADGTVEAVDSETPHSLNNRESAEASNRWILTFFTLLSVIPGAGILLAVTVPPFELTIRWNEIRGVNSLNSVGQLVPFMLSVGQLVHILYSMARGKDSPLRTNTIVEEGPCPKKQQNEQGHEMLPTSVTRIEDNTSPTKGTVSRSVLHEYEPAPVF